MKQILVMLCLAMSVYAHSQTINFDELENDSLFVLDIPPTSTPEDTEALKDSLKALAMSDHWTTKSFNPFKDVELTYPFKITFEDSTFASPVKRRKVVTSRYGWRWGRPHRGIDIDLYTGDKVMAMFDGKVRYARYVLGLGQVVVIRHDNGLETIYSHLYKQLVKPNQVVKKGQVIARGGNTGRSTGSHLHLVVSYKGVFLNPEYFFEFNQENKVRAKEFWVTKKWATPILHNSRRKSNIEVCKTLAQAQESEKNQQSVYVVKRGDTLSKISNRYNVSITSLCKTNAIRRNSVLRVGQKLIVTR
jgi:LysM repeat protein